MDEEAENLRSAISALDLKDAKDRLEAARLRLRLGIALNDAGKHRHALCALRRALSVLNAESTDAQEFGNAHTALMLATWFAKGPAAALPAAESAVRMLRHAEAHGASEALFRAEENLALCYFETGNHENARTTYQRILKRHDAIAAAASDPVTRRLNRRIALTYLEEHDNEKTERHLERSRPPDNATAMEKIAWLNAAALHAEVAWQLDRAVDTYRQIVALFNEGNDQKLWESSASLSNAGMLFADLGLQADLVGVQQLLAQRPQGDLPLSVRLGSRRLAANLARKDSELSNAGDICAQMQVIVEAETGADPTKLRDIVSERASIALQAGQPEAVERIVRTYLASDLPVDDTGLCTPALRPSLLLADAVLQQGHPVEARTQLAGMLVAAMSVADAQLLYESLMVMAATERQLRRFRAAILFGKLGAHLISQSGQSLLDASDRESFGLRRLISPLDRLIDDLIASARYPEADQIQSIRAVEAFKGLTRGLRTGVHQRDRVGFQDREQNLSETFFSLQQQLQSARSQVISQRKSERALSNARYIGLRQRADDFLRGILGDDWTVAGTADGNAATDSHLIDETLPASTAAIRFVLGAERPLVVLQTPQERRFIEIDFALSDLHRQSYEFWRACSRAHSEAAQLGSVLYNSLIASIESELAKCDRLSITAEGGLAYLPFAALHDGKRFLIERWTLVYQPVVKLAQWGLERENSGPPVVAGCGRAIGTLPPLDYVEAEIRAICENLVGVEVLRDKNFTTEALVEALARRPQLLHIASHFEMSPGSLRRSRLLTGTNEISVGELLSERFAWRGLRMLVLSACSTALRDAVEERMEELPTLFLAAGVKSVIAALWPVADQATAQLMSAFYRSLAGPDGKDPAEALARAQRAMLRGEPGDLDLDRLRGLGLAKREKGVTAHPYNWAGFKCHCRD